MLSALYGTATDLQGLGNQISNLEVNLNDIVHVVENSLSMTNKTNTLASRNRRVINNLVTGIVTLNENLYKIKFWY